MSVLCDDAGYGIYDVPKKRRTLQAPSPTDWICGCRNKRDVGNRRPLRMGMGCLLRTVFGNKKATLYKKHGLKICLNIYF